MSTNILTFTQENLKSRGFAIETFICLKCRQVYEIAKSISPECPNGHRTTVQQYHAEYLALKRVAELDTLTPQQWIKVLPGIIEVLRQRPQTTHKATVYLQMIRQDLQVIFQASLWEGRE